MSDDAANVQILPKHTPGPWAIERDNDTGPDDEGFWEWFQIGPARVDIHRGDEARAMADARLIAAAPDLLAALVALHTEALYLTDQLAHRGLPGVPGDTVDRVMAAARAAIARATGSPTP